MAAATATSKAQTIIKARTTAQLIQDFILTGHSNDKHIPIVRGWIMDELESRDPEAFAAWMNEDIPADEDLLLFF